MGEGRRSRRAARTAAVLTAVAALSLGLPGAAAADVGTVGGSATGASVTLDVAGTDVVDLAVVAVTLPADGSASPITDSSGPIERAGQVRIGRISASTQGDPGPGAVVRSAAQIADVVIGPAGAPLLTIGAVCSACEGNGSGASAVVELRVGGRLLEVSTAPNTVLELPGIGTLHVNEQIPLGAAGDPVLSAGIEVTALRLDLAVPGSVTGSIRIARSVCALGAAEIAMPGGAVGGILLTALVTAAFAASQLRRRRRTR